MSEVNNNDVFYTEQGYVLEESIVKPVELSSDAEVRLSKVMPNLEKVFWPNGEVTSRFCQVYGVQGPYPGGYLSDFAIMVKAAGFPFEGPVTTWEAVKGEKEGVIYTLKGTVEVAVENIPQSVQDLAVLIVDGKEWSNAVGTLANGIDFCDTKTHEICIRFTSEIRAYFTVTPVVVEKEADINVDETSAGKVQLEEETSEEGEGTTETPSEQEPTDQPTEEPTDEPTGEPTEEEPTPEDPENGTEA